MNTNSVSLGLSGVVLPYPRYKYPPELQSSSRLTLYSSYFNSIEVNDSFYKIPQRKTVERWRESVPLDFNFTFKLFQDFTHTKQLMCDAELLRKFVDTIAAVQTKSGCILVQFPPSFKSHCIDEVEKLLNNLKITLGTLSWNVAVEFRNSSWYNDDTFDLLKSQNVSLVLHDIPKSAAPFVTTSADFVYVRFHGPTGTYRGSYSDAFLQEYTAYISEWTEEGKKVYVYFNNTAGNAFENAQTFQAMLQATNEK